MTTTIQTQSEYRDLPIDWLIESTTNPRQTFEEDAMQETDVDQFAERRGCSRKASG